MRRASTPLRIHTSSWAELLVEEGPLLGLGGQDLVAPLEERRVVARPVVEPAAIELDDPGRQPLEEDPVVGDEDDRAAVAEQEGLEPADRLDVEVVRRLVEQEDVGLAHDGPRQEHPALHTRGELLELRVGVEADAGDHRLDAMVRAADLMMIVVEALRPPRRRRSPRVPRGRPAATARPAILAGE